jgi:glycosyltransferase involved in cell wall biosynthesis
LVNQAQVFSRVPAFFCDEASPPTISVIIPALNEAENLPHVLPHIPAWVTEVILIPGASSDNTTEVARQIMPAIRIVDQDSTFSAGWMILTAIVREWLVNPSRRPAHKTNYTTSHSSIRSTHHTHHAK